MNEENNIKESWTLVAFARQFGKPKKAHLINKDTGEEYPAVMFIDTDGNTTHVSFSSKMPELSAKEIGAQKDKLRVIQLKSSGNYKLCYDNSTWEEIDLGI